MSLNSSLPCHHHVPQQADGCGGNGLSEVIGKHNSSLLSMSDVVHVC